MTKSSYDGWVRFAVLVGLLQGVAPLVSELVLGHDLAISPAQRLPSPWWWLICLAVAGGAVTAIVLLEAAKERRYPDEPDDDEDVARLYDALTSVVFVVGLFQGLLPLVARVLLGWDRRWALAMRLDGPWWWLACLGITGVALVLLELLDRAKKRRLGGSG